MSLCCRQRGQGRTGNAETLSVRFLDVDGVPWRSQPALRAGWLQLSEGSPDP